MFTLKNTPTLQLFLHESGSASSRANISNKFYRLGFNNRVWVSFSKSAHFALRSVVRYISAFGRPFDKTILR